MGMEKLDKRTGRHTICGFVVIVIWRTFLQEPR